MNQVALFRVKAYRHRMQGQIENFIRHLQGKKTSMKFLKGIPDQFSPDLVNIRLRSCVHTSQAWVVSCSQTKFCEKLLKDFGYWQCLRPAKTLEIPVARLSMED
jgi:hypothetical protein